MIGIAILTGIALILGIVLVTVDSKLGDNDNSKEVLSYLPGANCGACGLNCADLAKEITNNPNSYTKCRVLRGENLEKFKKYLNDKYNI